MKYLSIIFVLFFSLTVFGEIDSSNNPTAKQPGREGRLSLRHRHSKHRVVQNRIGRFDYLAENFTSSLFSPTVKPLADVLFAGELDAGFGVGGKVTTQFGESTSEAAAVARQSDGKFILAGYSSSSSDFDFALARYNGDGSPDTSFGTGGKLTTDIGNSNNAAFALAIQPADGKLIAAGNSFNGTNDDFALVRYKTDGALDETFGTGGIVTTNFNNSFDYIDAVAIQTDGKIVAAGYLFDNFYFRFALARYNPNGELDETFGSGGRVTTRLTNFDDLARAIVLDANGKIVVAGEADTDFAVVRYNSDGSLDTSFDGDGKAITSLVMFDSAYDVAIDGSGKIIAVGEAGNSSNLDFGLVRYEANGLLDTTFGAGGKVTTTVGNSDETATSLVLQSNGKITVGGFSYDGISNDFALVRYNTDGSLDSSFGSGGKTITNFGKAVHDYALALVIQSNNRVIAVGSSNSIFAAAAYYLQTIPCPYSLSPTSANLPAGSGAGNFNITTEAGCSWTAVSNNSWITVTNTGSGNGTISFSIEPNTGAARTGTITVGGQNFTINQAAGALSYEADVSPRSSNGDGLVDATDTQQIERFSVGLDKPYRSNEEQRADCAPVAGGGDGKVDALDVQRAELYSVGIGGLVPANSRVASLPFSGALEGKALPKQSLAALRTITVESVSASVGQTITVDISVEAQGDEVGYTFSLDYDSTKLRLINAASGGIGGQTVRTNIETTNPNPDLLGVSVRFGGNLIPANGGAKQVLLRLTFQITGSGTAAVAFSSMPANQATANRVGTALQTAYVNGAVSITEAPKSRKRIRFI